MGKKQLPAPRSYHTATLVGDEIYIFGGESQQENYELWIFNTRTVAPLFPPLELVVIYQLMGLSLTTENGTVRRRRRRRRRRV
jgi:hypothetical protein